MFPAYLCDKCGKSFKLPSQLSKHKKVHNAPSYSCDHCPKTFNFKNGLDRHMDLHKNVKYVCSICNAEFISQSGLQKHLSMCIVYLCNWTLVLNKIIFIFHVCIKLRITRVEARREEIFLWYLFFEILWTESTNKTQTYTFG